MLRAIKQRGAAEAAQRAGIRTTILSEDTGYITEKQWEEFRRNGVSPRTVISVLDEMAAAREIFIHDAYIDGVVFFDPIKRTEEAE